MSEVVRLTDKGRESMREVVEMVLSLREDEDKELTLNEERWVRSIATIAAIQMAHNLGMPVKILDK